jgi:hypothetical protein
MDKAIPDARIGNGSRQRKLNENELKKIVAQIKSIGSLNC